MKRWIVITVSLIAMIAAGFYVSRPKAPAAVSAETTVADAGESTLIQTTVEPPQTRIEAAQPAPKVQRSRTEAIPAAPAPAVPPATTGASLVFDQAIETLVAPKTDYSQRQAAWKKLIGAGKLDQAIADLEQRVAGDPRAVDTVAALGAGYYKKAGQTEDVRERAILAMKADQTLESALNLDSANWDARFTKAVGMSHWPQELNKGQEVIEQFLALVEQQEAQAPQPYFAKTYLRLGEQYEKAGRSDYAAQIWQRGAALFPDSSDLKEKLAPAR